MLLLITKCYYYFIYELDYNFKYSYQYINNIYVITNILLIYKTMII